MWENHKFVEKWRLCCKQCFVMIWIPVKEWFFFFFYMAILTCLTLNFKHVILNWFELYAWDRIEVLYAGRSQYVLVMSSEFFMRDEFWLVLIQYLLKLNLVDQVFLNCYYLMHQSDRNLVISVDVLNICPSVPINWVPDDVFGRRNGLYTHYYYYFIIIITNSNLYFFDRFDKFKIWIWLSNTL